MAFRAEKLKWTVEKDLSTVTRHRGSQNEVVVVGVPRLANYLEGKLGDVPCQFVLDSGTQVSIVNSQVWEQATTEAERRFQPHRLVVNATNGEALPVLGESTSKACSYHVNFS